MDTDDFTLDSIREWASNAAGDFMLLESSDLQGLALFSKKIDALASECEQNAADHPEVANYASELKDASNTLKSIILDSGVDKQAAMEAVATIIEAGQFIGTPTARQHQPDSTAPMAETCSEAASESQSSGDSTYQPWVDDSIIAAYTEQQISVLPEMENQILSFENQADPDQLSALRRHIHTLKGESGVVGAMHIENVCHRIEDCLDTGGESPPTDALLAAIDWIGAAVRQFGSNGGELDPEPILSQLTPPAAALPADDPAAPDEAQKPALPSDEASAIPGIPISDPELAADFVAEAQEHFEAGDEHLLILEQDPANSESIGAVFRAFHTLKGVAGFLGLSPLGDLAHAAETLLDDVRKGHRQFTGPAVQATFNALDLLKVMVANLRAALEQGGDFPVPPELDEYLRALHAITDNPATEPAPADPVGATADASAPSAATPPPRATQQTQPKPAGTAPAVPGTAARKSPVAPPANKTIPEASQTMKVDATRIDLLLDTIGELVIAEAIVSGDPEILAIKSLRLERNLALLSKITRSLQDMGMSMRLVPIDPIFRKMARLVRDLSHKSGKKVELTIEGGDTELDKSMVDKLGDPLVHMIRNSMDHGLEEPDERVATGKPETGRVLLKAYHKGGSIHIDISDDGRGLNREAIVKKAIERDLIKSADGMADSEVFALIFEPGFSTAAKITEISGRGVGMDVVKRNIELLHGNVLVASTPGQGSTFTLALPLTTAIIDGMLSRVGQEVFILPTLSVIESFRPAPSQVHPVSGKGELIAFRGELIPMHRLEKILNVPDAETNVQQAIVIIIEEFGKHWGLMVDELLGQQQIVIKNIGDGLGEVAGVAGASILADGRPGLILDTAAVIKLAS